MAEYKHPEVLVSTEWAAQRQNDSNIRFVEVDVDTTFYEKGHIAEAVVSNWQSQLQDNVRRDLIGKSALEKLPGQSGISNDTTLLIYGDNNNWFAAYAFWQLEYYGHRHLLLMNGSRKKWIEEKRPLTSEVPHYPETNYKAANPDESIPAYRDQVKAVAQSTRRQLVDVRSPHEFTGKVIAPPGLTETAQRAGHIPARQTSPGRRRLPRMARSNPLTNWSSSIGARASLEKMKLLPIAGSASAARTHGSH